VRVADVAGHVGIVSLLGEHDLATQAELEDAVAAVLDADADVVVDLSETEFIDSSTIHSLERARQLAAERGKRVAVQTSTQHTIVERVLELTGAIAAWPVYRTRDEAVEALTKAAGPEATRRSA
jgi:anti-anti-sigma factor